MIKIFEIILLKTKTNIYYTLSKIFFKLKKVNKT